MRPYRLEGSKRASQIWRSGDLSDGISSIQQFKIIAD
jgi:hypothetical protein